MACIIYTLALCTLSSAPASVTPNAPTSHDTGSDKAKLERATQYFQSGKYHEALLLFQPLMSKYALNKRTIAYIGVCSYYEREYQLAIDCFAQAESVFAAFSPQEQSVYYFCYAESLMQQKAYAEALPLYEHYTHICHPEEKSEAWFKMASCSIEMKQWQQALSYINQALANNAAYGTLGTEKEEKLAEMKDVCLDYIQNGTSFAK